MPPPTAMTAGTAHKMITGMLSSSSSSRKSRPQIQRLGKTHVPSGNKRQRRWFSSRRMQRLEDFRMKKLILAAAAVALMSTGAPAQTTGTTGAARATVQIEPETRTRIKTYVTEHKVRPVTVKERIAVGATVPADVDLVAVPSEWGPSLTKYRYVYSNNRVLLVDPGSRAVVEEID